MIVSIFIILVMALCLAYIGKIGFSLILFFMCYAISVAWFIHHATDKLNLSF
ncbi:DUF5993 family protein [Candidatus Bandiella numerosa]|uniref:DUF5993 family protein n=1 Tax=Candidatus Bandiella numerosa TaxID=2570586 RepID=UPI00397736C8